MSDIVEIITENPPALTDSGIQLLPYSTRIAVLVNRAIEFCGETSDAMAIAAYAAVCQEKLRPTIDDLDKIIFQMTDSDFSAITQYLETSIQKRKEAEFDVIQQGKSNTTKETT
jgi:hypothetical protein